jgi:hypothetical protein
MNPCPCPEPDILPLPSSPAADMLATIAGLRDAVAQLQAEVVRLRDDFAARPSLATTPGAAAGFRQLVTLDQCAAIVHLRKRSLDRYREEMPEPVVKGGHGRRSLWRWADVRPWLGQKFARTLPESFPGMGR